MGEEKKLEEGVSEQISALTKLAESEISKIKKLKQPVVRVCGPLKCDGPEGYANNALRLERAEEFLKAQGMSVWTFGDSENEIFGKNYDHDNIFNYFHKPVLESGLIKSAYFIPRWDESNGATLERKTATAAGLDVKDIPEEWLVNND